MVYSTRPGALMLILILNYQAMNLNLVGYWNFNEGQGDVII